VDAGEHHRLGVRASTVSTGNSRADGTSLAIGLAVDAAAESARMR
jgi:hypothetical protein